MDIVPFIDKNKIFVPVRFLGYAIGLKNENITWDNATKTVRPEKYNTTRFNNSAFARRTKNTHCKTYLRTLNFF